MTSQAQRTDQSLTALFVRRPVLAFVINTLIIVAGLAAWRGVEIRELPDVDRPTITVTADYQGAAAEAVDRELTDTLEGAVSRVSGVKSISSTSSYGRSRVTVEFNDGVNLDVAASDMRDAVSRVQNNLPDGAETPRIVKADANSDAVMRLAITSDSMPVDDMTILVEDQVLDDLAAVTGVADVQVYGDREKIFRVDIDPWKLASLGLTIADVRSALNSVSITAPAGSITTSDQDIVVRTSADVTTPEAFENIAIGRKNYLRDVATVTLGEDPTASTTLRANGRTGIGVGIIRAVESNTLDISQGVRAAVDEIQKNLPQGMTIQVTSDDATFVDGAIHEVEIALALSVSLVLLVIFAFLMDWRATLIPGLSMPVALVGSIAAIYLAGFSVNILTLLALVLATGLVVDDAIVVLENIVRRRNEGMGPRAAAIIGTQEVFFAVIATTATLVAVFVPLSFLPGQTGGLFREFGFVLAMAVILSCVVALSLCPMLASRMLKQRPPSAGDAPGSGLGNRLLTIYRRTLKWTLDAPLIVVLISVLFAAGAWGLFGVIRQELTPTEDRSVILMRINAPQGVSIDYTAAQMREIERLIEPLKQSGEVKTTFANAGSGGSPNSGFMVVTLAPWDQRARTQQEISAEIQQLTRLVPGVRVNAFQPNSLGIRGAGSGLQFAVIGSAGYGELGDTAAQILAEMEKIPGFVQPRLSNDATQPQLSVQIDRERASDLGVDITGLAESVQAVIDGREITDVFVADRAYPVKLLSTTNPINDPTDLENVFLKTTDGRFVPLSTIATLVERAVPPTLTREQQLRSVSITSGLAPDFALGDAYVEAQRIAEPILPPGSRIVPLAEAATLGEQSSGMMVVFGFALVIILLVLAAQFESFVSAIIIMATVPLGLACAVYALVLTNTSLNAYSQIGLVLLVGVMAKNGILIVEFANQLRDRGLALREAIEQASTIRVRPVMMTMICTILGGLPLVMASGAGAEARIALGWVIVGGLGLATVSTLYLTPVAYMLLGRFITPHVKEELRLKRELDEAAGVELEATQ